jgi:hypothetical protein
MRCFLFFTVARWENIKSLFQNIAEHIKNRTTKENTKLFFYKNDTKTSFFDVIWPCECA